MQRRKFQRRQRRFVFNRILYELVYLRVICIEFLLSCCRILHFARKLNGSISCNRDGDHSAPLVFYLERIGSDTYYDARYIVQERRGAYDNVLARPLDSLACAPLRTTARDIYLQLVHLKQGKSVEQKEDNNQGIYYFYVSSRHRFNWYSKIFGGAGCSRRCRQWQQPAN